MRSSATPWGNLDRGARHRRCNPCETVFESAAALERHQEEKHGVRFGTAQNIAPAAPARPPQPRIPVIKELRATPSSAPAEDAAPRQKPAPLRLVSPGGHTKHPKFEKLCADGCGRSFVGVAEAKYCPACRAKSHHSWVRREKKYQWTAARNDIVKRRYDSRVKGRAAVIAAALGWPTWVIKKRAQELGLSRPVERQEWSEAETRFVTDHAGERPAKWIAKKLGRSETSVVLKFKRLKISRRVRDGYTMGELQLCFGTDHHVISRWMRQGKLAERRRQTERTAVQGGDPLCVSEQAIVDFIRRYPMEFPLDKVDQPWFMNLVLGMGRGDRCAVSIGSDAPGDHPGEGRLDSVHGAPTLLERSAGER